MHLIQEYPDGSFKPSKRIPQGRKSYKTYFDLCLVLIFLLVAAYCGGLNCKQLLCMVSGIILCFVIAEMIQRLLLFIEELKSLESRYDGNLKHLLKSVFHCHWRTTLTVIIVLLTILFTWTELSSMAPFGMLLIAVYILNPYLELKNALIYESIRIASPDVIDVGVQMAVSFFHGYLKILLPHGSTNDRGIKVMMDIYEAREKIKFARKALYILVPLSLHCPHQLVLQSDIMEEAASLNPIEEDRAGVKNRNYKNSVYKIKGDGGFYYVSAEYASPLKTFYESVNSDGMFADHYKHHRKDILWKFYITVKQLVNDDPTTRNLCEFIFYADYNKRQKPVDVGKVLLKRLVEDKARASSMDSPQKSSDKQE